jgi:hypothetical protein
MKRLLVPGALARGAAARATAPPNGRDVTAGAGITAIMPFPAGSRKKPD